MISIPTMTAEEEARWREELLHPGLKMKSTCTVDGCDHPVRARGYCDKHYMRWRKTGSTDLPIRPRFCSVCDGKAFAKGYCKQHYMARRRTGFAANLGEMREFVRRVAAAPDADELEAIFRWAKAVTS